MIAAGATARTFVELAEWQTAEVPLSAPLGPADLRIVEELRSGDRVAIDELRTGLRIRTREWTGVVRLEALELRIRPKQAGGERAALRMLDYALGIGVLARVERSPAVPITSGGPSLVDLIGLLLADATERILRDGLLHDYVAREEELPALRGRLRVVEQVRERYGEVDRLLCRYDEHEADIDENRLLAVALGIARRVCPDPAVRRRTALLHAVLTETCDPAAFHPERVRATLTYDRRNERYRAAHLLAWLFVDQQRIHDLFAPGDTRTFAFLIDMNALFERFVTRLVGDLFGGTGVRVRAQHREPSLVLDALTGEPYLRAVPDLLLETGPAGARRRIPVDAKYKLYDDARIDPADVYQTFFYAYGFGRSALPDAPDAAPADRQAWIVYPGTPGSAGHRLHVRTVSGAHGARIRALGLDVSAALDWAEGRAGVARPLTELVEAVAGG